MNSRWYFSATFRTASFETETHQRNLSLMCHTSWHRFFHRLEGQSRRPAILIKRKLSYVRPLTYSYGQGNIPGLFWLQIPTVSSSPPPKVPSVNNLCKALPTFRRRWSICVYVCQTYLSANLRGFFEMTGLCPKKGLFAERFSPTLNTSGRVRTTCWSSSFMRPQTPGVTPHKLVVLLTTNHSFINIPTIPVDTWRQVNFDP